jgi:hypothetical protein
LSNSINARQSFGSGILLLVGESPELKQYLQALRRRKALIVLPGRLLGFLLRPEFGDHGLHEEYLTCG